MEIQAKDQCPTVEDQEYLTDQEKTAPIKDIFRVIPKKLIK